MPINYDDSPDYLKGADLHNIGGGTPSFFSNPLEYVTDKAGSVVQTMSEAPSFAVTSVASGINSIYNTGVAAGNFFGLTDATENDVQTTLSSFDSSLGEYYGAHKQAADTVGFIATSFLPGIGGVKLLNVGQRVLSGALKTGSVGRNISEATGLIRSVTAEGKSLAVVAGEALASSQQSFTLMNAGVLKAIGSGVAQATLESAAFEAMVQATMFKSPVLEGQDIKDIGSNILLGGVVGGVIGGAINAAGTYGTIKKVITAADLEQKKFTLRNSQFGLESNPAAQIVVGAEDLLHTPIATNPLEETMRASRINSIELERRVAIRALAKGDAELGNYLADATHGMGPDEVTKAYAGAREIRRAGETIKVNPGHEVGYVRMHGEDIGSTSFDPINQSALTLADKLPNREAIDRFVKSAGFNSKKLWSPLTASSMDEIEARYIWAEKFAKYEEGMVIRGDDIPLLEGALRNKITNVTIESGEHGSYTISNLDDLSNEILQSKKAVVSGLGDAKRAGWGLQNKGIITSDEIARAANVSVKAIESEEGASMYARQDAQAAYNKLRSDRKLSVSGETDLSYVPRTAAVIYDSTGIQASGDLASAMVNIRQQQKIAQTTTDNAFAHIAGDSLSSRAMHPGDQAILGANRYGAGAGLVTFANGEYGTLASWAEQIGGVTADLSKKLKTDTSAVLDSPLLRLRTNQSVAIEFDKINNLVASTTERYILNEAGDGLIAAKTQEYRDAIKSGQKGVEVPSLQAGAPETIPFSSNDVNDIVTAHIQRNGSRVGYSRDLKAATGLEDSRNPNIFYPIKPNPRDLPYFAMVKDDTVTGAGMGHKSMIHASTPEQLDEMIKMVRQKTGYTVYTKKETEEYFKAHGNFEFEQTLHENYIDSALKSAGINNQFFPKTNPDTIADYIQKWHSSQDDILSRDAVASKFGHEFDQLETLGQQYTNIAGSRYATNQKTIEATAQNPYNDYRKTALNISRLGEYPTLSAVNRVLEKAVDGVYAKVQAVWDETKSVNDLGKVNDALQAAGVSHAYKNSAEIILANHTAPKPALSNFIRGANSILAATFLRLDPLNALNNAIGSQVLLGHETTSVVRKLLRDTDGIVVPGTTDKILSPASLIGKANSEYWSLLRGDATSVGARDFYKSNGWITSISEQHKSMLDSLSLSGTESAGVLSQKLSEALGVAKKLGEKGEVWTGNKLAEEYNRFVSASVAKQISDKAISAGVMIPEGQLAFINTFVNRTQGNVLASQRPLIFQGPIGQAVGLFQTFQFNTMQQLFRSVSEGAGKDAAMAMGLQGTLYGLNGLPGFQYINQHIVGTASGNPNHTDAYSTLYGAAGKTAGDWLMYGIPSNLLQTNIYSRGDINPRSLTVIPTAPQDVVAVSAFAKFAGNLKETVGKIAGGGDIWQTVLQGIEHNGLSRPLAGMAQTLQAAGSSGKVYSTTNAGDISFVNDFFSLATISRLGGGKPLDEALANDELQRSKVYQAADKANMKAATETFKTSVIGDKSGIVAPQVVENYITSFVHNGGRVEDFNKQMLNTMTRVNTPRANQVISGLKGPYAEHMKAMMNGNVAELE